MKKITSTILCILLLSACTDNSNEKSAREETCSTEFLQCNNSCPATIEHTDPTCSCNDWDGNNSEPGEPHGECKQGAYCIHQGINGPYTANAIYDPGPITVTRDSGCLQNCTQSLHQCNPPD